ncbi:MAG: hypothetical protein M3N28_06640 [Actinomycetota bacterium]|nr:hypothetical protein [Actinomycetota bacterium]
MSSASGNLLLAVGYPVSLVVIARWVPVVRERRWPWFAAHQAGVAAVVAGWLLRGRAAGAAANAGWLVAATVWYAAGGRDGPRP